MAYDENTQTEQVDENVSIPPEMFIPAVTASINLVPEMPDNDLSQIGQQAIADYRLDKGTMSEWLTKMEKGISLANLDKKAKDYPFQGASNIKYPLITSAALQFNARAYPAIVPSDRVVKAKTYGTDAGGMKAARGDRISAHMSWQLLSQITEWESETDKLLVMLPIVGSMVRKVWYDPVANRARCRVLRAGSLIVNEKVTSMANAPRLTEELPLYPQEIDERVASGEFEAVEYTDTGEDDQAQQDFIEQHTLLDLDNDSILEPYIVTVHCETQKVVRVVADFSPQNVNLIEGVDDMGMPYQRIASITRGSYFVKYDFLPSMDGSFWGTGLGSLLGDISESINTIMNMLIDAGHYASLGGGFIGEGLRLKGGAQRMKPGEWKMVPTNGGDIRNSIVPMQFMGPDATLFSLLGLLIEAGREIASVKDIMTGDSGAKNMTATTTIALIEQGMMVFSAAYKRIFRSMREEYKMIADINAQVVSVEEYNAFHDDVDEATGQPIMYDPQQDYASYDMDVEPVADPQSVTRMQEAAKAQFLMDLASAGLIDGTEAGQRALEAANIENTEELLPQPDPMQQQMGMMQMQAAQADLAQKMADIELTLAKVQQAKTDAVKNMAEADAKQTETQLDALMKTLEVMKDEMGRTLTGGLGPMAQPSGNGADALGGIPSAGAPEGFVA